jgi:hypothetical protein
MQTSVNEVMAVIISEALTNTYNRIPEAAGLKLYVFVEANNALVADGVVQWTKNWFANSRTKYPCGGVVAHTTEKRGSTTDIIVGEPTTGANKPRKIERLAYALGTRNIVFHAQFFSSPATPAAAEKAMETMQDQLMGFKAKSNLSRRVIEYTGKDGGKNDDYPMALAFAAELCHTKPYTARRLMMGS